MATQNNSFIFINVVFRFFRAFLSHDRRAHDVMYHQKLTWWVLELSVIRGFGCAPLMPRQETWRRKENKEKQKLYIFSYSQLFITCTPLVSKGYETEQSPERLRKGIHVCWKDKEHQRENERRQTEPKHDRGRKVIARCLRAVSQRRNRMCCSEATGRVRSGMEMRHCCSLWQTRGTWWRWGQCRSDSAQDKKMYSEAVQMFEFSVKAQSVLFKLKKYVVN